MHEVGCLVTLCSYLTVNTASSLQSLISICFIVTQPLLGKNYEQNEDVLNVKASGTYGYHCI
jgi:hypothetical protein